MKVMDELQIQVQILDNLEMKLFFHELLRNEKRLDDGIINLDMYELNEINIHLLILKHYWLSIMIM
jgi:hypothetical protein